MVFGKHVNKFYKKYFWYFFFGVLTLICVDYLELLIPPIIGNIVDAVSKGVKGDFSGDYITIDHLDFLIKEASFIALIGLGMFLGRFLWRRCIFGESIRIEADLRYDMFKKCEVLTQRFYKANKTGAILSYFSNDLETLEESFGFGIVQFVDGVFLLILSLVKMIGLEWRLTLVLLLPLFILSLVAFLIDRLIETKYEKRQKAFEDLSDFSQENFTGIRVIKAFVKEKKELKQFSLQAKNNKKANIGFVRADAMLETLFDILIYAVFGIIMFGGAYLVYLNINNADEGISLGELVTFIGYADTLIWPTLALGFTINTIARARTSYKRISKLLDEEVEIVDDEVVIPTEDIKGEIEFKHFHFAYPDDPENDILKDINIHIKAGETVGVVGKIGAGKSTLVNMLFRLYNVEEGTLLIDNYDIMHLPIHMVRDVIGYCPQDNFLFSDTIKTNIAFSNPDMEMDAVEKAADFSDIRTNILEFSDKYETLVGEKGVTLSGGQKQRISISRAIVKDPKILVLDDSVSAVDVKTEETILEHIKKQRKGKTTIVIASRVSTIQSLDKILVLNEGRVEAFGTHEECLINSKTYARMVELQTLEKELEVM